MTTPEPIQGWTFQVSGLPGKLQWEARWDERMARAWFDTEGLHVEGYGPDSYEWDVSYCIPLAVVDELRRLQEHECFYVPRELTG